MGGGYGDYAPKHWGSRLTLVFFVLASLVLVATSIGEFLETLVALEIRNERARKEHREGRGSTVDGLRREVWD